jgi:adhesin transport system outer membrane protein
VRTSAGRNLDGIQEQSRNSAAEIVLAWNLYNGGSDQARVRQQVNLSHQAADARDRVCRETRQTAAIAFNDTRKLTEQLVYLERNTLAIEKARDAYRQQFDIGQRSLLDLLNAENEVYTARRAYANAEVDLALAYARTQAALSQLATQLGIARTDRAAEEAAGWTAGDDAPGRCPADVVEIRTSDRAALDARAEGMARNAPQPVR